MISSSNSIKSVSSLHSTKNSQVECPQDPDQILPGRFTSINPEQTSSIDNRSNDKKITENHNPSTKQIGIQYRNIFKHKQDASFGAIRSEINVLLAENFNPVDGIGLTLKFDVIAPENGFEHYSFSSLRSGEHDIVLGSPTKFISDLDSLPYDEAFKKACFSKIDFLALKSGLPPEAAKEIKKLIKYADFDPYTCSHSENNVDYRFNYLTRVANIKINPKAFNLLKEQLKNTNFSFLKTKELIASSKLTIHLSEHKEKVDYATAKGVNIIVFNDHALESLASREGTCLYAIASQQDPIPVQANSRQFDYRGKIYNSIIETIGATPLVRLHKFEKRYNLQAKILVKLEFFNPLASVKDRIALNMIEVAEAENKITPGKTTLIEPTSGNTGIGLASVAAAKGYRLILTMPESVSQERRKMIQHLGAELVLTPAAEGMSGAVKRAKELAAKDQESFVVGQFDNPANPAIHRQTTAEEIWYDTNGKVDFLIAGVGTGGTITGVSQVLKARNSNFKAIAVEPASSPVLSGGKPAPHKIQGIGAGFIPSILDKDIIDEIVQVTNEEAIEMACEIAKLEGIPVGISSGAALTAAVIIGARSENKGKRIVVIIPSFAERYLSTALFANQNME